MASVEMVQLNPMGDERGSLIALETSKNVPFDIKRVYYIFDTHTDVSRGFHAHRNLSQFIVCISGSCRFVTHDGATRREHQLNSAENGLILSGLVWREMHDFSPGCVVMVLADQIYDQEDYIWDFEQFLYEARQRRAAGEC